MSIALRKNLCSGLLSAALIITTAAVPGSVSYAAATPKDVKGHWAQKYIEKAIDAGLVSGYKDGNFRPENHVTRAEFAHMLNSALGNTGTASINFKDVSSKDWYYSDVSKAIAAGYSNGYKDNTFGPNRYITRQEAAVMLATVIPTYGYTANLGKYPDGGATASWAKSAMERIVGKGYLNVYSNDGKLHPGDKMNRAQAATIIVQLLEKEKIVKSTTNVAGGSQLSNTIYSNGINLNTSSGSGSTELNSCVVLGALSVSGSGSSTLTLGSSRVSQATIQSGDDFTLVAKGETYVKNVSAANNAALQATALTGGASFGPGFVNVSVVKNAKVLLNGGFPLISLDGASSDVTLSSGRIDSLVASGSSSGSSVTIESGATLVLATASAPVSFRGTGTISKLAANASGITYEKKPGAVAAAPGIKAPELTDAKTAITPSPANAKTGAATDSTLTLSFSGAMRLYNGDRISKSDIYDFVELRRDSINGKKVSYTASIDSGAKVITIEPDDRLERDTQ